MMHIRKFNYIRKKQDIIIHEEEVKVNLTNEDETDYDYSNYKFDKESMESMAKEAERVFETFEMERELKALEEENYLALFEKYESYSTWELIKKLFQ